MTFFDLAYNMRNAGTGAAIAHNRREALDKGRAMRVEWGVGRYMHYWDGAAYDVRLFARDFEINFDHVRVVPAQ